MIGNATIKLEIISVAANEKFEPLVRKLDYVSITKTKFFSSSRMTF